MESDETAGGPSMEVGTPLGVRFEDALVFAADTHRFQFRKKTTIPYISHLLAVASLVLEDGGGEDEAIAALLHDAVEDQGGQAKLDEIRVRFGPNVARMVEACSDSDEIPKPPWRERKERHLRHLDRNETAQHVLRISVADKLHNLRSILRDYDQIGEQLWSRFNAGPGDQLWYYGALAEIYARRIPGPQVDELVASVAKIRRDRTESVGTGGGVAGAPDPVWRRLEYLKFRLPARGDWGSARPAWNAKLNYPDRFRGCLLAGAAGDSLGRPFEGRARETVASRLQRPMSFQKWRGWEVGPVGTVTDDTQLTILVAESLIAATMLDPADLAGRLAGWLPVARGIGTATRTAVERLVGGAGWWESGEDSDGNGAAMRVAPVGLVYSTDPDLLRRSAVLSSLPTHVGRTGLVGTVAQAFAVALALHAPPGSLDPTVFIDGVVAAIADLDDPGVIERRPERRRVRMAEQLHKIKGMLDWAPQDAFDEFYNGALVTESLPSAMWCFLASPEDPERVIETAVSGGRDADTVAAMAGALAGAYRGESALPPRWLVDLEYADELRSLADGLLALADLRGEPPTATKVQTRDVRGIDRFVGCLLGGAVGDALGAPIEFASIGDIRRAHGPVGVTGYEPAFGRRGAITDDTQMTLFTAEGIIRGEQRYRDRGLSNRDAAVLRGYQRWLSTQVDPAQVPWDPDFGDNHDSGWLVAQPFLQHRRAPGNTCLSALLTPGAGRLGRPINDSKGCGGVMRVAPIGLVAGDPFDAGCRAAALTHGHPSGWISAGALAEMIARLRHGAALGEAVDAGLAKAAAHPDGGEVAAALRAAIDLAGRAEQATPEAVEALGGGWVGEEALAISVYCALTAASFIAGVLVAVNHSGDSDSTGSITGHLLGAAFGADAIPADLVADLEGADVTTQIATDL